MAKSKTAEAPPTLESSIYDSEKVVTSGAKGNGESSAEITASRPAPVQPAAGDAKRKYRVTCHPNTPLAHHELEVEATSESEADALFFKANGITATHAKRTITPVE